MEELLFLIVGIVVGTAFNEFWKKCWNTAVTKIKNLKKSVK